MNPLILASSSPRRRNLLLNLGLQVKVIEPRIHEYRKTDEKPKQLTQRLALEKCRAVMNAGYQEAILGADTIVVLKDIIMGKPTNKNQAKQMLEQLRGKTHSVITGLAWVEGKTGICRTEFHETLVTMRNYTNHEIVGFISTGNPFDKAGGYAIQDRRFAPAKKVVGCYTNVVGLPLCTVVNFLMASDSLEFSALPLNHWVPKENNSVIPYKYSCNGCRTLLERTSIPG